MKSSKSSSGGVTLMGLVFVVFLALKLAEVGAVAHWSWWWVTAPLWLPFAVVVGVLLLVGVIRSIS